jgi:ELWxxDGT repeat protein
MNGALYFVANDGAHGAELWVLPPDMAPTVRSVQVNDGSAQRSRVTQLSVAFSTQVSFATTPGAAFTLTRNSDGVPVMFSATAAVVGGVTVVTLNNFTGPATQFDSLADGRYTLTALASQISADGQLMNNNFTFGDDQGLFRFYGDINGDRHVDIADFAMFSSSFNSSTGQTNYLAYLDFNGDGHIDIADFGQFSVRLFTPLP